MSASNQSYMEMVTVEFERERFERLCEINDMKMGIDYFIKVVKVPEYPYAENEKWKKQNDIATKAYKELKKIEFELRNTKGHE